MTLLSRSSGLAAIGPPTGGPPGAGAPVSSPVGHCALSRTYKDIDMSRYASAAIFVISALASSALVAGNVLIKVRSSEQALRRCVRNTRDVCEGNERTERG